MWFRKLLRRLLAVSITILLGGLLGATLVRLAPGFGVDERELDPRLSPESLQALRDANAEERNVARFYGRYLLGMIHGDLGISRSLNRAVSELLAARLPVTLRSLGISLVAAWFLALLLALPGAMSRSPGYDVVSTMLSGLLLCLPAAVLALLLLWAGGNVPVAIALVVLPRLFRYVRNLLGETYASAHVLAARARGLSSARILFWHVIPAAGLQLMALAGISLNMAFGAAIPVEVICDSPGIGQLAWQAALARDLPLLVNLTVLVAVMTMLANSASDLAIHALAGKRR
jgi:peptide/nickel transport system permease protein